MPSDLKPLLPAFASHADGWMLYPAVLFGLAIPALIYLFTRSGAAVCRRLQGSPGRGV
jgi:hypothetical protein